MSRPEGKIIWYINPYSGGPGLSRAYRPFWLAKHWSISGFKPTVITSGYHHLFYDNRRLTGKKLVDNIEYSFIPSCVYSGNGVGRIINMVMFSFGLLLFKGLEGKRQKPDVIIYSSPHLFGVFPARLLAWRYQARFILEVRDIWPMSLVQIAGASSRHPFVILNRLLERLAYRVSDTVVGLPSQFSNYLADLGVSGKNTVEIGNGFVHGEKPLEVKTNSALYRLLKKLRDEGKVIALYAGAHGLPNALDQFLEAAKKVGASEISSLCFVFIGDGPEKKKLQSRVKQLRLKNTMFFDAVEKEDLYSAYDLADIAFLGWLDRPIYRYGISPNKLAEYMGFGLPVVHATGAERDPVSSSGCGISVLPNDVEGIANAFLELERAGPLMRKSKGELGKVFVEENFSYKALSDKYSELFC